MFSLSHIVAEPDPPPAAMAPGRYLTDGVHLFRCVRERSALGTVTLEDCMSLDLVEVQAETARRLRPVQAQPE